MSPNATALERYWTDELFGPRTEFSGIYVTLLCTLGVVSYLLKAKNWVKLSSSKGFRNGRSFQSNSDDIDDVEDGARNIFNKLVEEDKQCVIFYGSQTGTAEGYARRLAKDASARFHLGVIVADLEEYDHQYLSQFLEDKLAIFVLATQGEGDPTDNAMEFWDLVTAQSPLFFKAKDSQDPLTHLRYAMFGLGNRNYEKYNAVACGVDTAFQHLGAKRIGELGLGDDAANTTEEDYLAWKESIWTAAADLWALTESKVDIEPTFSVTEIETPSLTSNVYLGELSKYHLEAQRGITYGPSHPFLATITESRELFKSQDRSCLHLEIDLQHSGLTYTTGDHLTIWPMNSEREAHRFLSVFGLSNKIDQVVSIQDRGQTVQPPVPSPTTYGAIARHYLEICGIVSRPFLMQIARFAPDAAARAMMEKLGTDKEYFERQVMQNRLNLAQVCETVSSPEAVWSNVPLAFLIEGVNKLKPRYYSISSSSLAQADRVSVTVGVQSFISNDSGQAFRGVSSHYLLALKQSVDSAGSFTGYALSGPRESYSKLRVPVHLRRSTFRLPENPLTPIIMIGPGTGVAPFRGFIQERAAQLKSGMQVGKMLLFFGCRTEDEDFIYTDDWKRYKSALGERFELVTAFSRQERSKVYVQKKLIECMEHVGTMLCQQNASIYICGDASNMAKEVNATILKIIAQTQHLTAAEAKDVVMEMKKGRRHQEDIW
ncbi:NADPH cytochrome P450 oxidoreductase [Halenospora varia]|nr:NADPH cytochrome P450 oxidoreductase [Halenospora varia]